MAEAPPESTPAGSGSTSLAASLLTCFNGSAEILLVVSLLVIMACVTGKGVTYGAVLIVVTDSLLGLGQRGTGRNAARPGPATIS